MKNKMSFILMVVAALFCLTACNLEGYINHFFEKETFDNSISFLQDEYLISLSDIEDGVKVYLDINVEDISYLEKITYSLDDESFGTISEEGVIRCAYPFKEGETYVRARIDELRIETIAKVSFIAIDSVIYGLNLNRNLVLDNETEIRFLTSNSVDYTKYEMVFLEEGVEIISQTESAITIQTSVIGELPFYITIKNKEPIIFKGKLTSKLNESIVESRVRTLLKKSATEIVTKEEMETIDNIDDGSIFVNKKMSSMADFNYFPLTKTLNLANNNIQEASIYLENLKKLNLSNNKISKIDFKCEEYFIEELNLANNRLSSFDDSKFSSLKILYLNGNNSLTKNLVLNGNNNLIYLNVNDCALNSLTINVKDNLTHILAAGNQLSDLSSFSGCQLKVLDIANNNVSSLAFLATNTTLKEIYLGGNPISTSELGHISKDVRKNIFRLNLSITGSKDMRVLQEFIIDCSESLVWLQIYGIGLTSVNWITEDVLPKLEYIKVSHNNISDFSTLEYIKVVVKGFDDYRQDVE